MAEQRPATHEEGSSSKRASIDSEASDSSKRAKVQDDSSLETKSMNVEKKKQEEEPQQSKLAATTTGPVIDVAERMGFLPPGSRISVHWDITNEDGTVTSRWWKATLLKHDGTVNDENIAIRVLEYDALPDLGYTETSRENVIFLDSSLLVDTTSQESLEYKILSEENDEEEAIVCSDTQIVELVNDTLANAMAKSSDKFQTLPPAMQAMLAEKIANKKEKLVELLRQHMQTKSIVSANDMKLVLAQTMSDDV